MERDHPVTPALKRAFDQTKRAILRDKAKADRAPEFQISDFPDDAHSYDLRRGEVAFPKFTYCVALAFILRRCELERTRWEDLTLDPKGRHRTLHIKKSKTDQEGKGVKRTLGCTCRTSKATCPVELYKNFARAFEKAFPGRDRAKAWLTSSPEGEKIIKVKLVNAWAKAAGRPVRGHSPRRSGTMFYVRAGLSIAQVTYLGGGTPTSSSSTAKRRGRQTEAAASIQPPQSTKQRPRRHWKDPRAPGSLP